MDIREKLGTLWIGVPPSAQANDSGSSELASSAAAASSGSRSASGARIPIPTEYPSAASQHNADSSLPAPAPSLDHPTSDAETSAADGSSQDTSVGGNAFMTVAEQTIHLLDEANGVDRLYHLADEMKVEPQVLEFVIEWLARNYYIRVSPDRFGDHEIRVTGRAKELISSPDRAALRFS